MGSRPSEDRQQFWTLCFSVLLVFLGHMMIWPLVPLYSVALGGSPALIGAIIAAAFLFPLFLAVPAGSLVDRYGYRGILIAGTLLVGLPPFLVPVFPGFISLGLLQVLAGLGQLLAVVSAQSFVATLGSGREREQNFGWYSTFVSIGQLVGPFLAGVLVDVRGFSAAFLVSGVISTLAILFIVHLPRPVSQRVSSPLRFPAPAQVARLLRIPGLQLALLVSGTSMIPLMAHQSFLPIFLDMLNYPATVIGAIISLRSLATVAVRPFMSAIIARLGGRFLTLTIMTAISAVGLAGAAFGESPLSLVAVALLVGLGLGITQPLTMVAVAEGVGPAERGTSFGLRLTANRLMQVIGPLALGFLAQTIGYRAIFPVAALFAGMTVVVLIAGHRHFSDVTVSDD